MVVYKDYYSILITFSRREVIITEGLTGMNFNATFVKNKYSTIPTIENITAFSISICLRDICIHWSHEYRSINITSINIMNNIILIPITHLNNHLFDIVLIESLPAYIFSRELYGILSNNCLRVFFSSSVLLLRELVTNLLIF